MAGIWTRVGKSLPNFRGIQFICPQSGLNENPLECPERRVSRRLTDSLLLRGISAGRDARAMVFREPRLPW